MNNDNFAVLLNQLIFHIDVNSAYLSWTALEKLKENPESVDLRTIPSIIGGDQEKRRGVVLAKSIPAKSFHIQTGEPVAAALRKCPELVIAKPNHAVYQIYSMQLMKLLSSFCPYIEQVSIDECYMDFSYAAGGFNSPQEAAEIMKKAILKEKGYTVNIGISETKILAKMASDFQKPYKVHTLFKKEIQKKLWPMPVGKLYMVGKSTLKVLEKLGISTIGELACIEPYLLEPHLKSHGKLIWEYANGIDNSIVRTGEPEAKGIGNSTTLTEDCDNKQDAKYILLELAESVSARLRESKQLANSLTVEIKYHSFETKTHQMRINEPSNSAAVIYRTVCTLFDHLWNGQPIRLLGIRSAKLVSEDEPVQLNLFDMINNDSNEKQQKMESALDCIREKYGNNSVIRGSILQEKINQT